MKQITIAILLLISIISFGQNKRFDWGDMILHDTLALADSDTLEYLVVEPPDDQYTWVYGLNYGDFDSTTLIICMQASMPTMGWVTISDTLTIDSTNTDRVYYWTGTSTYYPQFKFVYERDTVEDIREGWIRDIYYTRKVN